jgi:hypothetical protein
MRIGDIKRLASQGKSPYFFSKDTMEFFQSQVFSDVKKIKDGFLFITSEKFGKAPRHYRVRKIKLDGSISSGKMLPTLEKAKKHLKESKC